MLQLGHTARQGLLSFERFVYIRRRYHALILSCVEHDPSLVITEDLVGPRSFARYHLTAVEVCLLERIGASGDLDPLYQLQLNPH